VPERVWDTARLAAVVGSATLPNGGYRNVLLDDRLAFAGSHDYAGSARERFDRDPPRALEAFLPWKIDRGHGLVMLPISKQLRYLIPPVDADALRALEELLRWLSSRTDPRVIAIYGDDLEKAAGVGGWDPGHPERYERFLRWLTSRPWIEPVLLGAWSRGVPPAERRTIEPGTFFELARTWGAGEDYRGWYDDPNCAVHRAYLRNAGQRLAAAQERGADAALLGLGWSHWLHCCYENSWHRQPEPGQIGSRGLEQWAAALTSHARSCEVVAAAAEWMANRDGAAHAESIDLDNDGVPEVVIKNDWLVAVFSPLCGGRLTHLFDLTGRSGGRLVIGNITDDWNLQEELNRYMDQPRNHPGALADVGHEHDAHDVAITSMPDGTVRARLRNTEQGSPIFGTEKVVTLSASARHLDVVYSLPAGIYRLSTEICCSPHYYRLLRHGRKGLVPLSGIDWRGWGSGGGRVWVGLTRRDEVMWDSPHELECGHGLNLRVTSLAQRFGLRIGVSRPPRKPETSRVQAAPATGVTKLVMDPHFMRRFIDRHRDAFATGVLEVRDCAIRMLRPHTHKLTMEYEITFRSRDRQGAITRRIVGNWRRDDRGRAIHRLLQTLWQAGFGEGHLGLPRPIGYWGSLHLLVRARVPGAPLKAWIHHPGADWLRTLRRLGAWLAKLHNAQAAPPSTLDRDRELSVLEGWKHELHRARQPWLAHERARAVGLVKELVERHHDAPSGVLCVTHGDFHPENIFIRGDAVSAIDFEHCTLGEPASDIGYFLGQLDIQLCRAGRRCTPAVPRAVDLNMERLRASLIDEYCRTRPSDGLDGVGRYQARAYLNHLVHTIRMGGTDDPDNVTRWVDAAASHLEGGAALRRA
jgi:hypothetical protein